MSTDHTPPWRHIGRSSYERRQERGQSTVSVGRTWATKRRCEVFRRTGKPCISCAVLTDPLLVVLTDAE